ncbi:MAG: type II toxin-antitoxin system Phd/YefM family antitoxin [Oribacterium sp.]|nr:type II toxin-antitoxin system Phd/YefM family antitoxin [Oribacterium sp.]
MGALTAINYTLFRDHMKAYMDECTDNYDSIIITRKENKNVVMISEEVYNNLLENVHLMGNKANYDWLMESKRQLERGHVHEHELVDADD